MGNDLLFNISIDSFSIPVLLRNGVSRKEKPLERIQEEWAVSGDLA